MHAHPYTSLSEGPEGSASQRACDTGLQQHPKVSELYSALKTAAGKVPEWPHDMIVPVLCTVGMQSAGKTTFIEALVQFRVGTTCAGTGTRCPVRYILRDGEPFYSVKGRKLQARSEIQRAVDDHMRGLSSMETKFSKEELEVCVTDRGLPQLDITDLPGLKTGGDGAEEIKDIVRSYIDNESACPMVLVKATENVDTQADVKLLEDVGISTENGKAVFLVNYFNDQVYKFSKVSELNAYCKSYVDKYRNVFFCMLIYSEEAKKEKDELESNFEGQCAYYKHLPQKEQQTFDLKVSAMQQDEPLRHEEVSSCFGVALGIQKMQAIIHDFIVTEGKKWVGKVEPLEERCKTELRAIEDALKRCRPEYIKEQREKYVEEWGIILRELHQCESRLSISGDPMECGQSFSEELNQVRDLSDSKTTLLQAWHKDKDGKKDTDEKEAKKQALADMKSSVDSLDLKLAADASLWRLTEVFDATIYANVTTKKVSKDEALSISGYAPADMPGAFYHQKVVKEIATRPLCKVLAQLQPLLTHVKVIFEHALDHAHSKLKEKKHPGHTELLQEQINKSFRRRLDDKLKEANDQLQQAIDDKRSFIPEPGRVCHDVQQSSCGGLLFPSLFTAYGAALTVALFSSHKLRFAKTWAPKAVKVSATVAVVAAWALTNIREREDRKQIGVVNRSQDHKHNLEQINDEAHNHCQRLKTELLGHFKNQTARVIFKYIRDNIMVDIREDMRHQITQTDAKQIDEDVKRDSDRLKAQKDEKTKSLDHIRRVLDCIEYLNADADYTFLNRTRP
eukprot:TRINITY_DN34618_c0_g1_i1.p1 TRINITY_DN34618_c0_g1~~TRINITY_DN34618_c0_g1_i1.p1  ORF type:complete len:793 (+),score=145.77 TRINITY_DN34618_c0_g1_i1:38-2416(+)